MVMKAARGERMQEAWQEEQTRRVATTAIITRRNTERRFSIVWWRISKHSRYRTIACIYVPGTGQQHTVGSRLNGTEFAGTWKRSWTVFAHTRVICRQKSRRLMQQVIVLCQGQSRSTSALDRFVADLSTLGSARSGKMQSFARIAHVESLSALPFFLPFYDVNTTVLRDWGASYTVRCDACFHRNVADLVWKILKGLKRLRVWLNEVEDGRLWWNSFRF